MKFGRVRFRVKKLVTKSYIDKFLEKDVAYQRTKEIVERASYASVNSQSNILSQTAVNNSME